MERHQLLQGIANEIAVCPKCRLAERRTHTVPGEGSPQARLMFVGEAPGEKEDLSGRPFLGAAGQLLTNLLQQAGIDREQVFITNTVKCRPPQNRVPLDDEIAACNDYLTAQIAVVQPQVICPLGSAALKTLLGPSLRITTCRCKVFRKNGILFIPLYHPAAGLHNGSLLGALREDMLTLKRIIDSPIPEQLITNLTPPLRRSAPLSTCRPAPREAPPVPREAPPAPREVPPASEPLSLF